MHIGFTGTREGMTENQKQELYKQLLTYLGHAIWFHHGCCVGADAEAHEIAFSLNVMKFPYTHVSFVGHPCDISRMTAKMVCESMHKPYRPLTRNRKIVEECDVLIAAPRTINEELRSGTWATIRYARKAGKPVIVLEP
jgi:hypothetical protein